MSTSPIVSRDVMAPGARPLPIALIFDWSWSMHDCQAQILDALRDLPSTFSNRSILRHSAEIALITMGVTEAEHTGGHQVVLRTGDRDEPPFGFRKVAAFTPPLEVVCDGTSELDIALNLAIDLLERRCEQIERAGRSFYRPYIAIISDGAPTDAAGAPDDSAWRIASRRVTSFLDGAAMVEAFVPRGQPRGILPELLGENGDVREFDPAQLAAVLEAVSFSAERAATGQPSPLDRIRQDLENREGAS